ncbi:hypothetical protein [Parvularcula lutaonensis]|uniref:Uncharacterized protein n=1 Tax=Parvularcula lutaonensis TaxID=491923 RepID=A0ABV7MCD0_9PROT|nr:hypothetical protein [Parvularcula lutaonensis]GGY36756.1 hypothetical protein GCM10007148_01170 [Parvularcula lutaonensis]
MMSSIRRSAERRDWAMLLFELIIVVLGIYLGLALGNWNEERIERQKAEALIGRLDAEFESLAEQAEILAEDYRRKANRAGELFKIIRGEGDVPQDDLVNIVADIQTSSLPVFPSGTYQEMVATGTLGLIESPELLEALVQFDQKIEPINAAFLSQMQSIDDNAEMMLRYAEFDAVVDEDGNYSQRIIGVDLEGMRSDPEVAGAILSFFGFYEGMALVSGIQRDDANRVMREIEAYDE